MAWVPSYDEARSLLAKYNKEPFHITHGETVSGVLRVFSRSMDPGREDFWAAAGLLHDLDFELYPERHCVAVREILQPLDIDPEMLHAIVSHGWGMTGGDAEPSSDMEKVLYAVDELTGLIGAAVRMRPSGSVTDLELKSLKKKFKSPSFAAGCSRETIQRGADMLGWTLDELMERTIEAMRELEQEGM
ncbi:MAG: hydrolase [Firmicutes bacterium]|nr:hydrolase [Bacillota bacterium]